MGNFREKILWYAAGRRVRIDQPYVIAIGGGIAKTSTKVALGEILKAAYPGQVLVGYGNLNTLLGVPLSILGFKIDFHKQHLGPISWLVVLLVALWRSWLRKLPKYLVLEYGTDQPGDIEALVKRLKPNMAILTLIAPAHIEKYGDMEKVADDEAALVWAIETEGIVLINKSDPYIEKRRENIKAKKVVAVETNPELIARNFAAAAAAELDVSPAVTEEALAKPIAASQRFEIKRLKKFYLIDDSYNANPASMNAAINVLKKSPGRKVAILGTMLEMGDNAVALHQEVGNVVHDVAEVVIGVGEHSEQYRPVRHFSTSAEAAVALFNSQDQDFPLLKEGDSILVKGSRGVHMENIVEAIVKHGI